MSNEIRIQASLQIPSLGNYVRSKAFSADLKTTGGVGPSPGLVLATTVGTIVSFANLTHPGLCWLYNESDTYSAIVGSYDPTIADFYPLLELAPGEAYPVRLYRYLGEQEGTTGTATTDSGNSLMIKGIGATVPVIVEAFDR